MSADYHFITRWNVPGTVEEVADILEDVEALAIWWPSVYLDVRIEKLGDEKGVGKVVNLFTKGWLPYTLRWSFEVIESHCPHGFKISAFGDFAGIGEWKLTQRGDIAEVIYDWRIRADKPLLKLLSPILKPLFGANHHWAMNEGFRNIQLELRRRRGEENVPLPSSPTWPHRAKGTKTGPQVV
jgi:hypothetical protein